MNSSTDARWRTSSYSNGNQACVEVATASGEMGLRDTKQQGSGPELWVSAAAARAFVAGVVNDTLGA
ncbi:DUF397 domain-containing protein [Streptomyces litchfieldiae]|uniref:DUF397 domain-containing protein n=1 Tax=Streptomyces litchfieldiae TaxID=3075543 RepID=A0ABU2MWK3_9ACTN|nr:DUF397 domain-containing protein [Streptomyces sp. DSM 44938]MDT0346027.1 DUF397 domain-containing protein [Streptomyces sp. DSM 44938]